MSTVSAEPQTGHCKWFDDRKGYGFITPTDGTEDIFVHQQSIVAQGFRSLADGDEVWFKVEFDDKGRRRAVDVTGPNGSAIQTHQRRQNPSFYGNGARGFDNNNQFRSNNNNYRDNNSYGDRRGGGNNFRPYGDRPQYQEDRGYGGAGGGMGAGGYEQRGYNDKGGRGGYNNSGNGNSNGSYGGYNNSYGGQGGGRRDWNTTQQDGQF